MSTHPPHRFSQALERLPRPARRKYAQLLALIDDAEALTRAALARERDLDNTVAMLSVTLERIDQRGDPAQYQEVSAELNEGLAELKNLNIERSRRNSVRANHEQTIAQLRDQFVVNLNPDFVHAVETKATLNNGETVTDAILRLRREINVIHGQLHQLRISHLPASEIRAALIAEVDAMAKAGCPAVSTEGGKVSVAWPDIAMFANPGAVLSPPNGSASKLLAWMFRDEMVAALTAGVDDIVGGIPQRERAPRQRELEANLLKLERQEEALVVMALAQNLECHRRPHASGYAVLGIADGPPPETEHVADHEAAPLQAAE